MYKTIKILRVKFRAFVLRYFSWRSSTAMTYFASLEVMENSDRVRVQLFDCLYKRPSDMWLSSASAFKEEIKTKERLWKSACH